jgi:heme-degrading monooxygenase HmoA
MFVAIRRLKVQSGSIDEAVQRVENGLVPLLRSVPGFVEYDVVQVGEDVGSLADCFA